MKEFKEIIKDLDNRKKVYRKIWTKCNGMERLPKYIHIVNGEVRDDIGCLTALDIKDFQGKDWMIWDKIEIYDFRVKGRGRNSNEAWNNIINKVYRQGEIPENHKIVEK